MGSQENREETSSRTHRRKCGISQSGEEQQGDSTRRTRGNGSKIFFVWTIPRRPERELRFRWSNRQRAVLAEQGDVGS